MSIGLSQDREYGGSVGSRPMVNSGVGGAPGKRTLTEELGAGDGAGAAATSTSDGGGSGKPEDEQIGQLSAERIGADPDETDVGPDVPVRDTEGGKQEIAAAGQQLPPEGGADEVAGGAAPAVDGAPPGGGDDGGAVGAELTGTIVAAQNDTREAIAQSEADSAAYKAEMTAKRDQFEAEQHATMLEKLKTMSSVEKRQTLQEMGYDPKKVKKLKDAELDGILSGKMEAENRKTKILGMTPEELAALSPGQKIQYLVDLGIDKGDLDKAGQGKATQLFDDIMKVAHVPGQHEVKIKIKGGLLGKSWVVKVKCDAEGNTDIQAEKKGGFLSKLWGWVKLALPIILTVLAPLTAGASLIVLAIYQTATAIKNGDWLGAVIGAAGAVVGVGAFMAAKGALSASSTFAKIASVAGKVKTVAEKAQLAMAAAKAKNAGSLLAVLASGAEAFAKFSTSSADKFAKTMMRWSEKLKTWSTRIGGAEKVIAGIKKHDPLAAIGGAFETAASLVGPKNPSAKTLERASKITGFANAGKRALQAKPPDYAAVAQAALGIANQLHEDRRIEDASRIVGQANRLKQAWDKRESDPAGLVEAALGLSEAIQLAQYDLTHAEAKGPDGKPLPDADRAAITEGYKVPARIAAGARSVLAAATAKPKPNYLGAIDAATQLIADLTDDRRIDDAAKITTSANRLKQAWDKRASDPTGLADAALKLAEAIQTAGYDLTHAELKGEDGKPLPDPRREAISEGYKVPARIVSGAKAVLTAATTKPQPNYVGAIDAAAQLIADLTEDRRIDDAARITAASDRLKQAWDKRASDPAGLAGAAVALVESIDLARYDLTHDEVKGPDGKPLPDADRTAITERYKRATKIVSGAKAVLTAATAKPRPNYVGALDAATQLIAELTASKQIDAAAVVTSKLDAWTKAVNSKDEKAILQAGLALGEAIDGLRKVISDEHASAKKDAEAKLAPGETLPDDGGDALPPGPDASQLADPALTDPSGSGRTTGPLGSMTRGGAVVPSTSTKDASSSTNGPSSARPTDGGPTTPSQTGPTQDPLPRIDISVTVTAPAPAPPTPKPAPAPPVESAVQQVIDIIKAFAELADDFEHPLAKQFIAQWEQLVKTFEALRKNGLTASAAYGDTIASLKLLKRTGVFADAVAREWKKFQGAFGDPFNAPVTRSVLQSFGRFKRSMGRLSRVGAIPETFLSAADNVIVACGYNKDLSGAEASVLERLEAAANLVGDVASLPGELSWLAAVGRVVATKLGAASAVAAIRTVQTAVNRFGDKVGKVVMRWVAPVLEKLASAEGTQAAVRAAERIAAELAAWGGTFEAATTNQLFREAANLLAGRLGLAFRVGTSAPFAIALEVARLEAQFAAELYRDAYDSISNFMSARLFGKSINQLKNELRNQPDGTVAQCNALFKYAFYTMLSAADNQVRGGWLPYARQEVPRRVIGSAFEARFPTDPVGALTELEPADIKILIAAPAIKDIAGAYLDHEYKRVFGKDPV